MVSHKLHPHKFFVALQHYQIRFSTTECHQFYLLLDVSLVNVVIPGSSKYSLKRLYNARDVAKYTNARTIVSDSYFLSPTWTRELMADICSSNTSFFEFVPSYLKKIKLPQVLTTTSEILLC